MSVSAREALQSTGFAVGMGGGQTAVGPPLAVAFALALAAVHLSAGRLRILDAIPRSRWLSLSGGVAVAYVFVHILPEVERAGEVIERSDSMLVQFEQHVYLVALVGLAVFYGLERVVQQSKTRGRPGEADESEDESGSESGSVFWLHIGSFAVYNALIGYLLLHREESGLASLATYFVAMALHFLVNDYGLRAYHGRIYHRYGRWVLALAVVAGTVIGLVTEVGELAVAVLFAFLAGGTVLNVLKEELPAERRSRFWAFAAGALGYAVLLMFV